MGVPIWLGNHQICQGKLTCSNHGMLRQLIVSLIFLGNSMSSHGVFFIPFGPKRLMYALHFS